MSGLSTGSSGRALRAPLISTPSGIYKLGYNSRGITYNHMNPARSHNDLDLLTQLSSHAQPHLDALPPEDISQLADIFRLPPPEALPKVRRLLLEVLLMERQHFASYLQLPKFKALPPRTISTLQSYWNALWTAFCAHREQESKAHPPVQEVDRPAQYGLNTDTKDQPRITPFDYYRPCQPYPKFTIDQHKITFPPYPYYYNFQNYPYTNPYHQPQQLQPHPQQLQLLPQATLLPPAKHPGNSHLDADRLELPQQKSQKSERDKAEKGEKAEKAEKTERADKPDRAEKNFKNQKKEKGEKVEKAAEKAERARPDKNQAADKDRNDKADQGEKIEKPERLERIDKAEKAEASFSMSEEKPSKPKRERDSSPNAKTPQPHSNVINLRFLHCACLGHPIETPEKSFQCHECKNLFHFSCLHYASSEPKICPLCMLTRNHIFTETIPRPIKSGWFQVGHKECFVTKLRLDEDEMGTFRRCMGVLAEKEKAKDKEPLHAIEFRILRINEKSKLKPGRRVIKTCFPLIANELRKIEARHWIELKLKQVTEPSLIFYILALVRLKDRTRLEQDYLGLEKKSMPGSAWTGKEVRLLHPVTGNLLELPVRGESCDHLECEDLVFLYEQFQSSAFEVNNSLQCSHCKKAYTAHSKFTADASLFDLLKTRPANATKVRWDGGRLKWLAEQESMQQEGGGGARDS